MHNEFTVEDVISRGVQSGEELARVRKASQCNLKQFAEYMEVNPSTVHRWERDELAVPPSAASVAELLYWQYRATQMMVLVHRRAVES